MNNWDFLYLLISRTKDSLYTQLESLKTPNDRSDSERLVEFYASLDEKGKETVQQLLLDAYQSVAFDFAYVLDAGSEGIETEAGITKLELFGTTNGQRVLINDPQEDLLHEGFFGGWDDEESEPKYKP
jgi:hypothetical protein